MAFHPSFFEATDALKMVSMATELLPGRLLESLKIFRQT